MLWNSWIATCSDIGAMNGYRLADTKESAFIEQTVYLEKKKFSREFKIGHSD